MDTTKLREEAEKNLATAKGANDIYLAILDVGYAGVLSRVSSTTTGFISRKWSEGSTRRQKRRAVNQRLYESKARTTINRRARKTTHKDAITRHKQQDELNRLIRRSSDDQ
jgi:CRISPR/Cas system-associated endonuclease Cas1